MSRLGKKPIDIPEKVKVTLSGRQVSVEGPAGKTSWGFRPEVAVKVDGKKITVTRSGDTKLIRALHGSTRSILAAMVLGAEKGYQKDLEISGVGYNAKLAAADRLVLTLGYSHPVEFKVPAGLKVEVPQPTQISIKGADKRLVGEFAAQVRRARKVEPYNLKGIKYKNEAVRKKAGKTFVTGAS